MSPLMQAEVLPYMLFLFFQIWFFMANLLSVRRVQHLQELGPISICTRETSFCLRDSASKFWFQVFTAMPDICTTETPCQVCQGDFFLNPQKHWHYTWLLDTNCILWERWSSSERRGLPAFGRSALVTLFLRPCFAGEGSRESAVYFVVLSVPKRVSQWTFLMPALLRLEPEQRQLFILVKLLFQTVRLIAVQKP